MAIIIDVETIDKINNAMADAQKGLDLKAYVQAGVSMRTANELFTAMILKVFNAQDVSIKNPTLDDNLRTIADERCLENEEIDFLDKVRICGNNLAHPERDPNFNPEESAELFPKLKALVASYINNIDTKYDEYQVRKKKAEAELFNDVDRSIKKAYQSFYNAWKTKFEKTGSPDTLLEPEDLSDEQKIQIKKNIYYAAENYLIVLNKINRTYQRKDDYSYMVKKIEDYNNAFYKSDLDNFSAYFSFDDFRVNGARINNCQKWNEGYGEEKILATPSNSAVLVKVMKNGKQQPYEIRRISCVKSCSMPIEINNIYRKNTEFEPYRKPYKNTPMDAVVFSNIKYACENSFSGGTSWNPNFYWYIRTLHKSVENTKSKLNAGHPANPLRDIINAIDNKIAEQSNEEFTVLVQEHKKVSEEYVQKLKESNKLLWQEFEKCRVTALAHGKTMNRLEKPYEFLRSSFGWMEKVDQTLMIFCMGLLILTSEILFGTGFVTFKICAFAEVVLVVGYFIAKKVSDKTNKSVNNVNVYVAKCNNYNAIIEENNSRISDSEAAVAQYELMSKAVMPWTV